MKFKMLSVFALALLLVMGASGQTALTSTTFSAAVAATDNDVYVTSATGIAAATGSASIGSVLISGQEAMKVLAVSGTKVTVQRAYAGRAIAHASGATVYEAGPAELANVEPYETATCTAGTSWGYTPLIVPGTGNLWVCQDSAWQKLVTNPDPIVSANAGAAGTAVTATEYGNGRFHVTKLVFSGVAVGTAAGAEDEADGYKIYTLPAGAAVIHTASMSVGLTGSGTACDTDTPDMGLGTVIGTGDVATLDGTATFEDILTGQTVNNLTGTAEVKTLVQNLPIETAGAHTVHLNVADGYAGACSVTAAGTVWLEWTLLD